MASGHETGNVIVNVMKDSSRNGILTISSPSVESMLTSFSCLAARLWEDSETTSSALQIIVLTLTRYPEVQKKAQSESLD